jgi:SAM-dependent methyltransferase
MENNSTFPDLESADAYNAMAPFYERHWGTMFLGSAKRLFSDFLRHIEPGASALDLCCGTGEFAEWLDTRGLRVTGVDHSVEMLACARAKVRWAQFYKADMRAFNLPIQFDVATCFYNSINQALTLADLGRVLRSVRRHLCVGGWFLFDFVEEDGYIDSWETDEVVHLGDRLCQVRYRYDPVRGLAFGHVTIGEASNERQHEFVIRQRPFKLLTLRIELENADFTVESVSFVHNAFPPLGRRAVLARAGATRPGEPSSTSDTYAFLYSNR